MTLIELIIAFGILSVAVGCLVQTLVAAGAAQTDVWNRRQALRTAESIAEDLLHEQPDWRGRAAEYAALEGIDVVVQNGDGTPASGWAHITVRVQTRTGDPAAPEIALVFGRSQ